MHYGPDYIIPTPFDPRLMFRLPVAVAKAAMESGVATENIKDWDEYRCELGRRVGINEKMIKWYTVYLLDGNPKSYFFHVIITNIIEPLWLKEALGKAKKLSQIKYCPSKEALEKFDQINSMKNFCKEYY
mgnify:CR=1 FL=1